MKKPLIIIGTSFVLATGFLIWWFSDTQVIKRQTVELTELFTMSSGDGKASRVASNQNLAKLLDQKFTCTIDLDNYQGNHGRDALLEAHLYLGQSCQFSSVQVSDINIQSQTDSSATVQAEFSISVRMKGGSTHSESSPATLTWAKTSNDEWRLAEVILKSP